MKYFRKTFFGVLFVFFSTINLHGESSKSDSLSSFTFSDGKIRKGKLLRLVSDSLIISVRGADSTTIEKRFHKSIFTRVVLPDSSLLDLSQSTWPPVAVDDWNDVETVVQMKPVGSITVTTGDIAASVYLDSVFVGTTPVTRDSLSVGNHALRVTSHGYEPIDEIVSIAPQKILNRTIVLEHSQTWKDSVKAADDSLMAVREKEYADSVQAVSDARISTALKSANSIDNLRGMMDMLFANLTLDSTSSKTIAVLPFTVAPGVVPQAGSMASEYAVVYISSRKGVSVVERAGFSKMMQELALSQTDVISESRALEAGKVMEARYLVMGNVTEDQGKRLVSVRLVETETGAVLSAAAASIKIRDMDLFAQDALGEKRNPAGALFRSTVVPGWGQFYTGRPGQGCAAIALTLGGTGAFAWSISDWSSKRTEADRYRRTDPSTVIIGESPESYILRGNKKITAQNDAAKRNVIIGASLGGVWVLNMLDALICGIVESKQIRTRYFSIVPVPAEHTGECALLTLNINTGSNR
ncbi:MAG: PEGA domain-containing protein [Fibrobacter sp.]|nr:PEGA domain-containing protein [Fibrobacter sp.]